MSNVSIFVLFALLASAMGRPGREEFRAAKQKCIEETGVDPELVRGPPRWDRPVDEKLKCFTACMMLQLGGLREDGTFDVSKAIDDIPEDVPDRDKIADDLNACAEKKGVNDCDTAHEVLMCLHELTRPYMRPRGPPRHPRD